jgi:lipopolysaccharide transport system ATP-binding protein
MSNVILKVEHLSKRYRLGMIGRTALHEDLSRWLARVRGRPDPTLRVDQLMRAEGGNRKTEGSALSAFNVHSSSLSSDHVWALRDVSFSLQRGEVLGVIGRNGSGKSTLLKILSRVTGPTSGSVRYSGRVASLLEVGTGFHPELSGRDNIYLNGAILGMTRAETSAKFDEIVDFSGCGRFIDTPVKRYSSGMYVRLAFAVAAHLEPEILIVDEVLAVGDFEFQAKCLGKMQDVASHGRTVLFVSHNMSAITKLCTRGLVLQNGEVVMSGDVASCVSAYTAVEQKLPSRLLFEDWDSAPGDTVARIRSVEVLDEEGRPVGNLDIRKPVVLQMTYWDRTEDACPTAIFHCRNERNDILFATNEFTAAGWKAVHKGRGLVTARCHIPGNFFAEGRIVVLAAVHSYNPTIPHALLESAVSFKVVDPSDGDGVRGPYVGPWPGLVRPMLRWETAIHPGGLP